jgi:hypothetical protein
MSGDLKVGEASGAVRGVTDAAVALEPWHITAVSSSSGGGVSGDLYVLTVIGLLVALGVRAVVRRRAERRNLAAIEGQMAMRAAERLEAAERLLDVEIEHPEHWSEATQFCIHDAAVSVGCLLESAASGYLPKGILSVERLKEKQELYAELSMVVYETLRDRGRNPDPPWALVGSSGHRFLLERDKKRGRK